MSAPLYPPQRDPAAAPAWLIDAVLGVAVFGAIALAIAADIEGDRDPGVLAYVWALTLGALMLIRRRFPIGVLGLTILGMLLYYMVGYPVIGLSVPAAAALYSAAEFRRVWWSVAAAGFLLLGSYFYRIVIADQDLSRIIGYELAGHVALMAAAIALGMSMRLRRELQASTRKLVAVTAEQERARTEADAADARAKIARELHDSLGHQSTVVSMHADVIRESLESDPQTAAESASLIKQASKQMLGELRQTVRTLRRGAPNGPRELPSLNRDSLQKAIFDQLPLTVEAEVDVPQSLSDAVQSAVHRILQEALTNTVKHSHATAVQVAITASGSELRLLVSEPGPARSGSTASGFGLHGMRERVEALGGSLTAGPEGTGFRVEALIPVERADA